MDTARQFIPMAPVCTVTADQVVHDFQGDIPAGVKFRCPSCDRPVQFHRGSRASTTSADASGDQAPAVRRNPRSHSSRSVHRTVRPHFRHAKNDPVARFCERYQAGLGLTDVLSSPLYRCSCAKTQPSRERPPRTKHAHFSFGDIGSSSITRA